MKVPIYSIFDMKSELYGEPAQFYSDAGAVRSIVSIMRSHPESTWSTYREDFRLKRIGTFDQETGILEPETPVTILDLGSIPRDPAPPVGSRPVQIPGPDFKPTA